MDADVVVVGGGPGWDRGFCRRRGWVQKTCRRRAIWVSGRVDFTFLNGPPAWWREERTTMPGGVVEELDQKDDRDGCGTKSFSSRQPLCLRHGGVFKYVADEYIQENGVIPIPALYGSHAVDGGDAVAGIITESKSGRLAIPCEAVVGVPGTQILHTRPVRECHGGRTDGET